MELQQPNNLHSASALRTVFIEQLSVLYSAKKHLISSLPDLIKHAAFQNLKLALSEDLEDTNRQMICIRDLFRLIKESAVTDSCLGMNVVINEAHKQIVFHQDKKYESDMSIIFYMSVIANLQVGAGNMLNLIAQKQAYLPYAQFVRESLDMEKDNATLFKFVAAGIY